MECEIMTANGPVYARLSAGAYLTAPTGVRAPWRAFCFFIYTISFLKVKRFEFINQYGFRRCKMRDKPIAYTQCCMQWLPDNNIIDGIDFFGFPAFIVLT